VKFFVYQPNTRGTNFLPLPLQVEESHRGFLASLLSVTTLDSINVNSVLLADGYRRQELSFMQIAQERCRDRASD
jgi:hypothetical protein